MTSGGAYIADTVLLVTFMLAISAYVLYYYVRDNWRKIEWWVLFWVLSSFWICICPPALLLVDVDAASTKTNIEVWMGAMWMFIFWATQVLSWVILPIIQEYVGSGEFTPWRKFFHSLSLNTRLYLILGVISVLLLVYVWFAKGLHSIDQLVNLVIAAANAFGLFLIIVFLAYGMATIPKRIWRRGDLKSTLDFCYWHVPSLHDDLDSARVEWAEATAAVRSLRTFAKREKYLPMIERIEYWVQEFESSDFYKKSSQTARGNGRAFMEDIDLDSDSSVRNALVKLHSQIKHVANEITRLESKWRELRAECFRLEDHIRDSSLAQHANTFQTYVQIAYWRFLRKILFRLTALGFVGVSMLVAWSEFTLPFNTEELGNTNLSVVSQMMNVRGSQITWCSVILGFMAFHTYWSVFQFKLFHYYTLTPHHSDPASLCFTATFLTRIIMPLCYNFLNIAHMTNGRSNVTYSKVFGDMDVIDFLGPWFNRFLPMLVLIFYACLFTNLFGRFLAICGISTYDVRNASDDRTIEGKDIIARVRRQMDGDVYSATPSTTTTTTTVGGSLDDFVDRRMASPRERPTKR
jgi:hypothetical protein